MTIAIACMFVVCLALPLILIVAWHRRTGATYAMAALGAAVFVVFARILEQLLHLVVLVADTPVRTFVTGNPWVYALYGGLAAGLFEECGRFTAFRLLKKRSARQEAVLYGLGHGGMEMVLIGAMTMLSNLILLATARFLPQDALAALSNGQVDAVLEALQALESLSVGMILMSLLERVCALVIQVALSIPVFIAAHNRRLYLLPLAVLLHAAVDFPAALYQVGQLASLALVEGLVALLAVLFAVGAVRLYRRMPAHNPAAGVEN